MSYSNLRGLPAAAMAARVTQQRDESFVTKL